MASNIKIFNSYLKGFKTLKGNFPVFISSSVLNCNNSQNLTENISNDSDINEDLNNILMTSDSDEYNKKIILFDIFDNGDYYFLTL